MPARDDRQARYIGDYDPRGAARIWHVDGDYRREIARAAVASPDGLAWGYVGNGPADTARTILADATHDPRTTDALHLAFAAQVVHRLPRNERFELPVAVVEDWLMARGVTLPGATLDRAGTRTLPITDIEILEWAHELEKREHDLERVASQLAEREQRVAQAEARLARAELARRNVDVTPGWTLPAQPVADELRAVIADTNGTLEEAAREFGLDEAWARDVLAGHVTEVDVPHIQQICEGWSCTPYAFWGTEVARAVVHAYPPELWPQHTAPLADWGLRPLPGGPEGLGPDLGI
jgi:hypothetical protein